MTMRYFKNTGNGVVYGYDDVTQAAQVAACAAAGWTEVTGSWPPAQTTAQLAAQTVEQNYAAALAAGLAVTSTATAALSATYATDEGAQKNTQAISAGIAAGEGLPGGGTTFTYPDAAGTWHTFTQAQFLTLAAAIRNYVYALDLYAAGQGSLPTASATIP